MIKFPQNLKLLPLLLGEGERRKKHCQMVLSTKQETSD
jgi:hypothetical protein